MSISFYPRHEHNCPNVNHCPHLGGAALGTLVLMATEQELNHRALHATIDAERARGEGRYRVVLYRHEAARCEDCGKFVQKAGDGEILNSRIGPHLRSTAIYLRNVIGISYCKIPQAIEELFGITFTPAALIGFETMLAEKAKPIVDDIAKKLTRPVPRRNVRLIWPELHATGRS